MDIGIAKIIPHSRLTECLEDGYENGNEDQGNDNNDHKDGGIKILSIT